MQPSCGCSLRSNIPHNGCLAHNKCIPKKRAQTPIRTPPPSNESPTPPSVSDLSEEAAESSLDKSDQLIVDEAPAGHLVFPPEQSFDELLDQSTSVQQTGLAPDEGFDDIFNGSASTQETDVAPVDQLFVESTPSARSTPPARIPCWSDVGGRPEPFIPIQPMYDFRPGPRDPDKFHPSSWLDQDPSATYDPSDKKNDPYSKYVVETSFRKRRALVRDPIDAEHRIKYPKFRHYLQGRREGKRLVVILKFHQRHEKLDSWGTSFDHWPDAKFTLPNGEPDWETWWNQYEPSPDSEMLFNDSYHFRDRTTRGPAKYLTEGDEDLEVEELTLGHPAARGCKACFEFGFPCSLVEGQTYPCFACVEDGMECELVLEPPVKKSCNSCSKKRIVCPFASDGTIRGACEPCEQAGMQCMAGPKGGLTRTGPSLDVEFRKNQALMSLNTNSRSTLTSCAECTAANKNCSLRSGKGKPPCIACEENGKYCTFAPHRLKAKRRPRTALPLELTRPLAEFMKLKEPVWKKTITTRLAHPTKFYREPIPNSNALVCHWCDDLLYGLIGLQEVTVEVIDRGPRIGYVELSGGHTENGYPSSKMCTGCTHDRLMLLFCGNHEQELDLQPIEGMNPHTFEFEIVMDFLAPGAAVHAPWKWCAVCPSPAFYECVKDVKRLEEVGMKRKGDGITAGRGCGLVLCDVCALALVQEHGGNLDSLISTMKQNKGNTFAVRADAELLIAKGELVRRVIMGEMIEEVEGSMDVGDSQVPEL